MSTGAEEEQLPDGDAIAPGNLNPMLRTIAVSHQLGTAPKAVQLTEGDRLQFARHILAALFLICLAVFIGYYFEPENKAAAAIFEVVKIGMLPLVTLVIGFYFPNKTN